MFVIDHYQPISHRAGDRLDAELPLLRLRTELLLPQVNFLEGETDAAHAPVFADQESRGFFVGVDRRDQLVELRASARSSPARLATNPKASSATASAKATQPIASAYSRRR